MRLWYVLYCGRIGTSVALPAGENCDEVTNLVSCDTSVLYPVAPKAARPAGAHLQATETCNLCGIIFGPCSGVVRWIPVLPALGAQVAGGTLRCLSEESESPRLDKKRGPGEYSELVLGLLPRPGIK